MDLLVAISSTATESEDNLVYSKEVIYKIIEKYGIRKVKYSLLTFGKEPHVYFKFNSIFDDVDRLKLAIDGGKMRSSGVSLQTTMEKAKEVFDEAEGWCCNVIALLIKIVEHTICFLCMGKCL